MGPKAAAMVAAVIDRLERQTTRHGKAAVADAQGRGSALRFFVREGVRWRELRARPAAEQLAPPCAVAAEGRPARWSRAPRLIRMVRRRGPSLPAANGGRQLFVRSATAAALPHQPHRPRQAPGPNAMLGCRHQRLAAGAVPSAANVHDTAPLSAFAAPGKPGQQAAQSAPRTAPRSHHQHPACTTGM